MRQGHFYIAACGVFFLSPRARALRSSIIYCASCCRDTLGLSKIFLFVIPLACNSSSAYRNTVLPDVVVILVTYSATYPSPPSACFLTRRFRSWFLTCMLVGAYAYRSVMPSFTFLHNCWGSLLDQTRRSNKPAACFYFFIKSCECIGKLT